MVHSTGAGGKKQRILESELAWLLLLCFLRETPSYARCVFPQTDHTSRACHFPDRQKSQGKLRTLFPDLCIFVQYYCLLVNIGWCEGCVFPPTIDFETLLVSPSQQIDYMEGGPRHRDYHHSIMARTFQNGHKRVIPSSNRKIVYFPFCFWIQAATWVPHEIGVKKEARTYLHTKQAKKQKTVSMEVEGGYLLKYINVYMLQTGNLFIKRNRLHLQVLRPPHSPL